MAEEWEDTFDYETVSDGPNAGPILIGVIAICLGIIAIVLLLGML